MRQTRGAAAAVAAAAAVLALPVAASAQDTPLQEVRTLDGSNNNLANPDWGKANTPYTRVAPANYADGIRVPVGGPAPRRVSNRIFNDGAQNMFSESGVTQWGFAWGQFMDHTFGLRQEAGGELQPLGFDSGDPLEDFVDTVGGIPFNRTPAAPGTGTGTTPREQIKHAVELHRRLQCLRRDGNTARVAARGTGRRRPVEQRRQAAAGAGRHPAAP